MDPKKARYIVLATISSMGRLKWKLDMDGELCTKKGGTQSVVADVSIRVGSWVNRRFSER